MKQQNKIFSNNLCHGIFTLARCTNSQLFKMRDSLTFCLFTLLIRRWYRIFVFLLGILSYFGFLLLRNILLLCNRSEHVTENCVTGQPRIGSWTLIYCSGVLITCDLCCNAVIRSNRHANKLLFPSSSPCPFLFPYLH